MKRRHTQTAPRWIASRTLIIACSISLPHSATAFGQQSQSQLAQQLLSADSVARFQAFQVVRVMDRAEIGDEVRVALITLLARKNELVSGARQRGVALSTVDDPSFRAALSRKVASLQDPRAIPVLAEASYGGSTSIAELVRFGELAVPELTRVAASTSKHYSVANYALTALTRIVESPGGARLSAPSRARIRGVAAQRLSGAQHFTTLWSAIDLAVALGDSVLLDTVRLLAADENAVRARGVVDDEVVRRTQERATKRLSERSP
jgi:hypothetical protein